MASGHITSAAPSLFIGLMSGTSLDGVDGVLLAMTDSRSVRVLADASLPLPSALRQELLALNIPGHNELHRAAVAAASLVAIYAGVVSQLLQDSNTPATQVQAIGAHGQTVRHAPSNQPAYTWQLNQPALLAELTGITVVADFRSRDIAAGGQGAPLVPAFHRAVFGQTGQSVAVVNIGGMANVSALHANGLTQGCDSGPGNVLLDLWCAQHTGNPFDNGGAWASQGQVRPALLQTMLATPYFQASSVKSTGRDLFNSEWLDAQLAQHPGLPPADVQATLVELTARSIVSTLDHLGQWERVYVCGGGAHNQALMRRLQALLGKVQLDSTAALGWPVSQVEAAAFAWLAQRALAGLPGNEPQVTGALGPRVLGAIYPA